MGYRVKKSGDSTYQIIENNEYIIHEMSSEKKAHKLCRGLNLGNGFQEETPRFFFPKHFLFDGDDYDKDL